MGFQGPRNCSVCGSHSLSSLTPSAHGTTLLLVRLSLSVRPMPFRSNRINGDHQHCKVVVRHFCNMLYSPYPSDFGHILDCVQRARGLLFSTTHRSHGLPRRRSSLARIARKLRVLAGPPQTWSRSLSVEDNWSYKRFVHGTFGAK